MPKANLLSPVYPRGKTELESSKPNDSIVFDVSDHETAVVQLVRTSGSAWPASLVVAAEVSLDGATFGAVPAGAVTFTQEGVASIELQGARMLRVRVSTPDGTVQLFVTVTGSNS